MASQSVLALLLLCIFAVQLYGGHRAALASLEKEGLHATRRAAVEAHGIDATYAAREGEANRREAILPSGPVASAPPPPDPPPGDVPALLGAFEAAERAVADVRRRLVDKSCHAPDCWWQAKPEAAAAIASLRAAARRALAAKYGPEPYVVRCRLAFPPSMPDFAAAGPAGDLVWTMAPAAVAPYSSLFFLERVVAPFEAGAFHRNAPHVLQAQVQRGAGGGARDLAFQEATGADFPHAKHTLGFAGRPGGAGAFYVNARDNARAHGGDRKGEPDAILGKLIGAAARDVAGRMRRQPGGTKPNGFVRDAAHHIRIDGLELLGGDARRAALADDA